MLAVLVIGIILVSWAGLSLATIAMNEWRQLRWEKRISTRFLFACYNTLIEMVEFHTTDKKTLTFWLAILGLIFILL